MAETAWAEETGGAPKKRAIPTWAWFCGAGCLAALVLAIVAGVFLVDQWKKARDPERQWQELAEALPYDHRPEGWELGFGFGANFLGFKMYFLQRQGAEMAIVMHLPEREAEETRKQMFDEKFSGGFFGMGARSDTKLGTIEVQGRTLPAMWFYQKAGEAKPSREGTNSRRSGGSEPTQEGASVILDVTPEGEARPLILQLIRVHASEPYTDEEVRAFLQPFHVGPDR